MLNAVAVPLQWDNYLVEGTNMRDYLVLLCVEFLLQWRNELITMEFQEIIMWLQVSQGLGSEGQGLQFLYGLRGCEGKE